MCPFPCLETIRIEKGEIFNLAAHNKRMNQTREELFGCNQPLDLRDFITPKPHQFLTKCRVVYDAEILQVEYALYEPRRIERLRLIDGGEIDYTYKSTDRLALNALFEQRGAASDVLIVKEDRITDTTIGNVALLSIAGWLTPEYPLLCGTQRASLLAKGLLHLADICVSELSDFSSICIFNAMVPFGTCVLPISAIER